MKQIESTDVLSTGTSLMTLAAIKSSEFSPFNGNTREPHVGADVINTTITLSQSPALRILEDNSGDDLLWDVTSQNGGPRGLYEPEVYTCTQRQYRLRQDVILFKRCNRFVNDLPKFLSPQLLLISLKSFRNEKNGKKLFSERAFKRWAAAASWHHHRSQNLPSTVYEYASLGECSPLKFLRNHLTVWAEVMGISYEFSTCRELALDLLERMSNIFNDLGRVRSENPLYRLDRRSSRTVRRSRANSPPIKLTEPLQGALDNLFEPEFGVAEITTAEVSSDQSDRGGASLQNCLAGADSILDLFEDQTPSSTTTTTQIYGAMPGEDFDASHAAQLVALWRRHINIVADRCMAHCDQRKLCPSSEPLALVILTARRLKAIPHKFCNLSVWSRFFGLTASDVVRNIKNLSNILTEGEKSGAM